MDEKTFEKMEDAKWPPPLRRNKLKKTFVKILMRITVTAPLPPRVDVVCPKGRKYAILIHSDPTPKVCLNCFCTGHFDFECCGTKEATVEIMEDDAVAVEDFLGGDLQLDDCFDTMSDEVDGEQGAVTTDGVESFEDSTVVEAVNLSASTCDIGDALVGELEAVHTILDGLSEQSLVERTAAVLEVQSLLPATIAADGSEGTVISDGFVCCEDPPVVEVFMESDSGSGVGLLGVEMQEVDCLSGIRAYIDGVHGAVIIDKAECHDFSPVVEAELAENFHYIQQVFSVVNSPKKHHKWREKSDVQGLLCCSYGLGSFGSDEDPSEVCKETAAVLPFSDSRAAYCGVSAAAILQGMADPCMIDEQASSGVIRSKKHHLWCDLLDEQGLFSFEDLDMLQIVSRLVWSLAATYHDQLIFKIHHKWRHKKTQKNQQ